MKSIACIVIHPSDNVGVVLEEAAAGDAVVLPDGARIILAEPIAINHKFALRDIPSEAEIIKYGAPIGLSATAIGKGCWIHTHNLKEGRM